MTTWLERPSAEKLQLGPLIGRGFTSDIYAWDRKLVLKLFHSWVPADWVEREHQITTALHSVGLPVPETFGIIQFHGQQGIIFEKIDGVSMLTQVQARPWTLFRAVRNLAALHDQIHRCPCPNSLPSHREKIATTIDNAPELPLTDKKAAHRILEALPDGDSICHRDFHPENILFTKDGPVVIDWGSAARGHPFGDVAWTSHLMQHAQLPPWTPRYMHWLLRCARFLLHRSYLKQYFQLRPGTLREIQAWALPVSLAAKAWRLARLSATR